MFTGFVPKTLPACRSCFPVRRSGPPATRALPFSVSPPSIFDAERTLLREIDDRLTQAKNQEEEAFRKLTEKAADGNLRPLTHSAVEDFASAVNHVETLTKEQNFNLRMYAPRIVDHLHSNLRIVSILGGVLFLAGWCLALLGHIYGLEGTNTTE
jgi:hypothetical protein